MQSRFIKPKFIVVYGPPGAGKGSQADLIASSFGFIHFDTGKYLESLVHSPMALKNAEVRRERILFDSGKLMTSSWVLKVAGSRMKEIAQASLSLVLSGSPRTVSEAKNLLPVMKKLYGQENMIFFVLKVSPKVSLKRNSGRLICSVCSSTLLRVEGTENFTIKNPCPFCGGKLLRRILDHPSIIKDRLIEFNLKTKPIFAVIKKDGYKIKEIQGDILPFKVFNSIKKEIIKI